jgi:hypothetical protein
MGTSTGGKILQNGKMLQGVGKCYREWENIRQNTKIWANNSAGSMSRSSIIHGLMKNAHNL